MRKDILTFNSLNKLVEAQASSARVFYGGNIPTCWTVQSDPDLHSLQKIFQAA